MFLNFKCLTSKFMWPMLDLITDIAEVVCCLRVGLPNAAPSSSVFWSRWRLLSRHCPALCGANEAAVPDPDHWRRFSALEADLLSRFCSVSAWLTVTRMSVASEGLGMPLAYHFSQPPVRRGGSPIRCGATAALSIASAHCSNPPQSLNLPRSAVRLGWLSV
jgi:hypothetical protein